MSYYSIPKIQFNDEFIDLIKITNSGIKNPFINKSLSLYLNKIKCQIDDHIDDWDKYKKYTNNYEYIHTNIPKTNNSICRLKPLSRSFYKMIEIYNVLSLSNNLNQNRCITYHLAEGPGGFIEAISYIRNNSKDTYYGISLLDENESIPGWKKSKTFLENNENVIIENGIDNTGNLLNTNNLLDCYTRLNGTIDFITGDGGFDFSVDFNKQEITSSKLILTQIAYIIAMLKPTKDCVIKFFDMFTIVSIELLYILSSIFNEIIIFKPNTSRNANSERYVVCKHYNLDEKNKHKLIMKLKTIINQFNESEINSILDFKIPSYFINKIEEINAIFGQQQIESILSTLTLISNHTDEKLEILKKNNIQKCIKWCQRHSVPFNKNFFFIN